ncbi:polysaccharide deacetylase family protein [Salinimicrobium sp. CDJ15-81-2]|nr:polysaccharide deacetylase family protein [Salinimicrobium nanhaiense]
MNEVTNNGALVISLDFELLWGIFDVINVKKKKEYFENTRRVIPEILHLFEKNNIHATWATVGMLFNRNWEEWEQNSPDFKPTYNNPALSAYEFMKQQEKERLDKLCFAPEIIKQIQKVPGQEIGSHTYSHYYCQEEGQTVEQFQADLEKAISIAQEFAVEFRSLVFPRNQFREEYLKVCYNLGIRSVRSNPASWYWKNPGSNGFLTRLFRTGDVYNVIGKKKSYAYSGLIRRDGFPLAQKASRFLRPTESMSGMRALKLKRIKAEMTLAAKKNEIYHLWWHPHNFGVNPDESLKDLKVLVGHYRHLKKQYNFQSLNMDEIERMEPIK